MNIVNEELDTCSYEHPAAPIKSWFSFPEKETHCQVATALNGQPHVRTMKLYEITREGSLVVLTRRDAQKWRDLAWLERDLIPV